MSEAPSARAARLLLATVARIDRLTRQAAEPRLARLGVSWAEFRLVGHLVGNPEGLAQVELAERLGVTPAAVSLLVTRLVLRGVVARRADPGDSRACQVRIAGGAAALQQAAVVVEEIDADALQGISAKDLKVARSVLARIAENLESHPSPARAAGAAKARSRAAMGWPW